MTDRTLRVFADGEELISFRHACLEGREALGLLPMPYRLRIRNLSDSDYYRLKAASGVEVLHDLSVLASGQVSDVYRRLEPEGTLTEVMFSPGLSLWEATVSLTVEAGVTVSETVRRILQASGTGISLVSFPGPDPVRRRPQAFFGRAAECVCEALSAAGGRGYLTPSGLCVVPRERLPVSLVLSERDLLSDPVKVENLLVVRTPVTGWPLGKMVSVQWKGLSAEGLIAERGVNADTQSGSWVAELVVQCAMHNA